MKPSTVEDPQEPAERTEFVTALARGLEVLQAFSGDRPVLTLTEVAQQTGLSRGTARRLLHTLLELGYVHLDGRQFRLTPRVLNIGYSYLSSMDLPELARPEMERLVARTGESCSIAVLDRAEIVYVARVPSTRIMAISLGLGSRLPAYATSMGRVLMAALPPGERDALLASCTLSPLTAKTITEPAQLLARLEAAQKQGWALVDQEYELGVRSIAAPLHNRTGCAVAALNISGHAGRVTLETLREQFLPHLLEAAARISDSLAKRF